MSSSNIIVNIVYPSEGEWDDEAMDLYVISYIRNVLRDNMEGFVGTDST
jgi:hypothetical protein